MSSNEAFDVEHFDDLIAAVDSIDIPTDGINEPEPPTLTVEENLATPFFISDIDFGDTPADSTATLSARYNESELHNQLDAINTLSTSDDVPSDVPLLLRKNSAPPAFHSAHQNEKSAKTANIISPAAAITENKEVPLKDIASAENKNAVIAQPTTEELTTFSPGTEATELALEMVESTSSIDIDEDFGELESLALASESEQTKSVFTSKEPSGQVNADLNVANTDNNSPSTTTSATQTATYHVGDEFAELQSLSLDSESAETAAVFDCQEPAAQPFVASVDFEQHSPLDNASITEEFSEFDDAFSALDSLSLTGDAADDSSTELLDGFGDVEESIDFSLRECATSKTAPPAPQTSVEKSCRTTESTYERAEPIHQRTPGNNNRATETNQETIVLSQNNGTSVNQYLKNPPNRKPARKLSLYYFSQRFPLLYLGLSGVMALAGFAYILMIPALFGVAMFNAFEMLTNPFTSNTMLLMLAYFSISLFLFLVSYKLFDLKFVGPEGITLDESNAKSLLAKLTQLKQEHRVPRIHQIVLTRRHELNVIKAPRFGLPIWSKNVLAIGYPLLQTLTPDHFEAALSRRLLQYTKNRHVIFNWLSFMRRTWTLYAESLKQRNGVIDLLHYCFFAPYASAYRRFAVYVTQKDELLADEAALEFNNDRDLVKGAQTIRITQAMLLQYFWPKLDEAIRNHLSAPAHIRPYHNLPGTLSELLNSKNIDTWFIRLAQETKNPGSAEAPFYYRMERMGHSKVSVPRSFELSAARYYFGDEYQQMTDLLDDMWAKEVQEALFIENLKEEHKDGIVLPSRLSIEPA